MKRRFDRTPITISLLAIITIVFAIEWATGALVDQARLVQMGAIVPGTIFFRQYWRLVAAMFLHASLLHWLANSWALYQLGSLFEAMFGSRRMLFFYFATGLVASTASSLFTDAVSVGASGAIFGILGALIFSIKRSPMWRNEPWTRSLLSQLIFWAIINIGLGFSVAYIDNVAHIAGLITGLLLGFIPHRVPPPPPNRYVVDVTPYDESHFPQNHP